MSDLPTHDSYPDTLPTEEREALDIRQADIPPEVGDSLRAFGDALVCLALRRDPTSDAAQHRLSPAETLLLAPYVKALFAGTAPVPDVQVPSPPDRELAAALDWLYRNPAHLAAFDRAAQKVSAAYERTPEWALSEQTLPSRLRDQARVLRISYLTWRLLGV